tara:strand:- start:1188 stop:3215 length:2028 start_codon:yes stop_codon:yes gene_type:complete
MNLNINKNSKLILLLISLIFCIYEPKYLAPFLISIGIIYICNKKFKNNNIESFQNNNATVYNKENFDILLNKLNNNNILEVRHLEKSIQDFLDNMNEEILKSYDEEELKKTKFIKEISDCYFFNTVDDYKLIINLNYNYRNLIDLQNKLEFSDFTFEEDFNDDPKRNELEINLNNETLKKLGLLVYKTKFSNIKRFFIELITNFSLYTILNNKYILTDENQKIINKEIYELVIIIFYIHFSINKEFDFNQVVSIDDINLYNVIQKYFDNDRKNVNNKDLVYEQLIDRIDSINSYQLKPNLFFFPKQINILNKFLDNNLESSIEGDVVNLIFDNITNETELENFLDFYITEINDHFDKLKLLDISLYRVIGRKERKIQEINVKSNYFILFLLQRNFDSILEKIDEKGDLLNLLYNKKRPIFSLQVSNELEIEQKYNFTSVDDVFYENIFYYFGNLKNKKNIFKRIFIYPEKQIFPTPSQTKKSDSRINTFSEYQQKNFELELDDFVDDNKIKEKQEEALTKYYEFLDKENYSKINTLGKLAEERNKELKIKELSFDKVIDNFGKEVFNIIDEIGEVVKKFYKNENLESLTNEVNENLYNPKFKEHFNEPNMSMDTKSKYLLFIKSIIGILLKEGRIVYVGFIFIIIALFLYFIDAGSNNNTNSPSKINSIFDLLKL